MKTCPICELKFPDQHRTCPTDGVALIESNELEPGAIVRGNYRIVQKLGQGGMGLVYLADNILMNVRVALKFLASELSHDPRFIKRFRTEARTMFLLQHPNVAKVHSLEQHDDGSLFLAMEYVDGPNLRVVIESAPHGLPIQSAIALVRGIASGLGAAHEQGVVHRDVKPENILLTANTHQPKVLDFGIAAAREGATAMSRTGGPLFTPEYAAPEQWKGMATTDLDGRTDIYALGGVFYELLTGQTAWHAQNVQGWMYQHLNEVPVAPSQHRSELRAYPGLDELVLSMLAKEREQRPATMGEFLARLDNLGQRNSSAGRTTYEPPPPTPNTTGAFPPPPPPANTLRPQVLPPPVPGGSGNSGKWIGAALVGVPVLILLLVFLFRSGGATADPVMNPGSGSFPSKQAVSISDATPEAVIHYTTDGSVPSEASPIYSEPLRDLPTGATVRAIAFANGHKPSHEISGTFNWIVEQAKAAYDNKHYPEARGLFKQACDGGDKLACNYLAYDYADGKGGAKDLDLAQTLFQKSCEDGVIKSCASAGSVFETRGNMEQARAYYQRACEGGSSDGCKYLHGMQ